jgi:RNA polymerase sigma-70 factor (ECF subfamily)
MDRCVFPKCDCAERARRYRAGDRAACGPMIRDLEPYIRTIARRILAASPPDDWDDAVSEVFLKVFRGLGSWREQAPFCYWVRRVAIRRLIDLRRQAEARIPTVPLPTSYDIAAPQPLASAPDLDGCVEAVLGGLSPERRRVFDLAYNEGRPVPEVAQTTKIPIRTVYDWLKKIRASIRDCMEKP